LWGECYFIFTFHDFAGADIHVKADDGNTALHLAVGTKSSQLKKVQFGRIIMEMFITV
jgi:hypothetical protein